MYMCKSNNVGYESFTASLCQQRGGGYGVGGMPANISGPLDYTSAKQTHNGRINLLICPTAARAASLAASYSFPAIRNEDGCLIKCWRGVQSWWSWPCCPNSLAPATKLSERYAPGDCGRPAEKERRKLCSTIADVGPLFFLFFIRWNGWTDGGRALEILTVPSSRTFVREIERARRESDFNITVPRFASIRLAFGRAEFA